MSVGKEVIYESPDVPEPEEIELPKEPENGDIERVHLDLTNAVKRFAGKFITAEGVDFTVDGHRKLKGYNTGAYTIEFVGREYPEPETPDQKFNRLQMEILELKDELQNGGENRKPDIGLTEEQISELSRQLEEIQLIKAGGGASEKKGEKVIKTADGKSQFGKLSLDALVISNFEARLNKLEKALGSVDDVSGNLIATSGSVSNAIDDIKTRVNSLNPTILEQTENRLNALMAKQKQENEKADPNKEYVEKVNEIYKMVVNFQNSNELLNNVVKRLKTLAVLHEQAGTFSNKLNELHAAKKQISENVDNNKIILKELGDHLKETIQSLRKEVEAVKTKI